MLFLNNLLHLLGFFLKPAWIALVISSPMLIVYYDFWGGKTWLEHNNNNYHWLWLTLPGAFIIIRKVTIGLQNFLKDDEK